MPEALKNALFAGPAVEGVQQAITRLLGDAQDMADDGGIIRRGQVGMLRREGEFLLARKDFKGAESIR